MPAPETCRALARELGALPRRQRRAVLDSLSPDERAKVDVLLSGAMPKAAPPPGPAAHGQALELFSPCIRARLDEAEGAAADETAAPWRMTPAARHLLRQSASLVAEEGAPPAAASRSLAAAFGDLLAQGWRKR